jgi:hypothetical protein
MVKTALIYGVISGLILVASFGFTIPDEGEIDFRKGETIGMVVMVISLALILFAIRAYRKALDQPVFTFGQGFRIGILTALIASVIYVAGWMVFFESVGDNFTTQYKEYYISQINTDNALTDDEKVQQISDFERGVDEYTNSAGTRILMTFTEIFPIGFLITLISALLLRKKGAVQ